MSNCYFPLRSSVELFGDRRTPAAVTRAKQAAVLYDRLFIEVGLLQVHVLDAGSSTWWTPPEQLSPERLERTRQAIEPGTPMSFGMAMQPARGVPAEEPGVTVSQGRVLLDYAAEFHTGILDELAPFEADWVHEIGAEFPNVRTYRSRLLARPSFARAVDEARPYRSLFPLGAPDRD